MSDAGCARSASAGHENDPRLALSAADRAEIEERPHEALERYAQIVMMPEASEADRADVLRRLGRLGAPATDDALAERWHDVSRLAARSIGDHESQCRAAVALGNLSGYKGAWGKAIRYYDEAIELAEGRFPRLAAQVHLNRAAMRVDAGQSQDAVLHLHAAESLWRHLGEPDKCVLYNLRGMVALGCSDLPYAEDCLGMALRLAESDFGRAMILDNFSELYIQRGEPRYAMMFARLAEETDAAPRARADVYLRLAIASRLCGAEAMSAALLERAASTAELHALLSGQVRACRMRSMLAELSADADAATAWRDRAVLYEQRMFEA